MRQAVALVVGGAIGFGLLLLLRFSLELLVSSIGGYAFLVIGIVAGLLVGVTIGIFSKELGTVVGLVLIILLCLAGAMLGFFMPSISAALEENPAGFSEDLIQAIIGGVPDFAAAIEGYLFVTIILPSYFMAGLIAGAISGVSYDPEYSRWRSALMVGVLAGILVLGFTLLFNFATGGVLMDVYALVLRFAFALVLGAFGGAIGGRLAGVRV